MAQFSTNGNKIRNIVAIVQQGISLPLWHFVMNFQNSITFLFFICFESLSLSLLNNVLNPLGPRLTSEWQWHVD